jgi:branched-chain amino acid transport system permease protein
MLYREAGQFKTSYQTDQQIFPIRQDRWVIAIFLAFAIFAVPLAINDYWANAVLLPLLVYAMAALGLNILVGYCGQISLGLILVLLLSGGVTAAVGVLFGLPSLRIKGFYLAVATLAAQFFLVWLFNKVEWFYNYNATGQITMPPREVFGFLITGPEASPAATYLFTLGMLVAMGLVAKNVVRGRIGRMWMAIRDMDIAAELIGVRPLMAKLSAFAVSSFYVGVAGGLYFTVWLGAAEVTEAFDINQSFLVLFMVIIGGLGSILGSFLGAAFLVLMPLLLKNVMVDFMGIAAVTAKHVEITLMGVLIIFFLIVEPHGLARLWQILKEKLRLWPFPY